MELYLYYTILMDFKIHLNIYMYIHIRINLIRINDEYKNIFFFLENFLKISWC